MKWTPFRPSGEGLERRSTASATGNSQMPNIFSDFFSLFLFGWIKYPSIFFSWVFFCFCLFLLKNEQFLFASARSSVVSPKLRLPGFSFYWLFIEYDSFVSIVNLIWFDQLGLGWKHLLTGFYWVFHRFRCVTSASYRVFLVVQGFFFGPTTERKQVYRVFTEFSSKDSVGCWFCFVLSAKSTAKDVEQKKNVH